MYKIETGEEVQQRIQERKLQRDDLATRSVGELVGGFAAFLSFFLIPFYTPIGVLQVFAGWGGLIVIILVGAFFKRLFDYLISTIKGEKPWIRERETLKFLREQK